jgi:hypothetical protein
LGEKEKRSGSRGVGPMDVVIIIRRNRMRLTDEGAHAFGKRKTKEKRRRRRYYKQHTSEKSKEKREADTNSSSTTTTNLRYMNWLIEFSRTNFLHRHVLLLPQLDIPRSRCFLRRSHLPISSLSLSRYPPHGLPFLLNFSGIVTIGLYHLPPTNTSDQI